MQDFRIVFLGTPEFAVPSIEALCKHGLKPVLLVSQEDKPQGRKRQILPTPVHAAAKHLDIPCFQPTRVKDQSFYQTIADAKPDFLITAAYGRILPKRVLELPSIDALNIHASLLPKYRGASPVHHALINGDEVSGISIMRMVEEMDKGPVFRQAQYKIPKGMRADELMKNLSYLAAEILPQTLIDIAEKNLVAIPQDESQASYVGLLDKNTGAIDWAKDAQTIENLVRGTYPWPGAFATYQEKRAKILKAQAYLKEELTFELDLEAFIPGQVVSTHDKRIWVKCGLGVLAIDEIQISGSRVMSTIDCAHNYSHTCFFENGDEA